MDETADHITTQASEAPASKTNVTKQSLVTRFVLVIGVCRPRQSVTRSRLF